MKTNGLTHARAKNGIILSLLALTIAVPAVSQVSLISFNDILSTVPENRYAPYEDRENDIYEGAYEGVVEYTSNDIIGRNDRRPAKEFKEIRFKRTSFTYPQNSRIDIGISQYSESQLLLYAIALKQYAIKNGFDTTYGFLGNMGMLCNKKRFFVVNLTTMQIEQAGLVSHGRGQGPSVYDKQYSNRSGSRCTSLGRYKIMRKYKGGYGEAYKIAGLDSSNQNAYSRSIVLHSMGCIPDRDGMMPACVSEGCPAVSINFLSTLSKIIDSRKKPILLWIFDSNLEQPVVDETRNENAFHFDANNGHRCSIHGDDWIF